MVRWGATSKEVLTLGAVQFHSPENNCPLRCGAVGASLVSPTPGPGLRGEDSLLAVYSRALAKRVK